MVGAEPKGGEVNSAILIKKGATVPAKAKADPTYMLHEILYVQPVPATTTVVRHLSMALKQGEDFYLGGWGLVIQFAFHPRCICVPVDVPGHCPCWPPGSLAFLTFPNIDTDRWRT